LYRSARVKEILKGSTYDTTRRVYPSAGASYTLEIYPVVHHCEGLESGFYHYCPHRHVLEKLTAQEGLVDHLLQEAVLYTGNKVTTPQVLLLITSRFGRILWKYDGTALSLILKDVGGLFQTMYLVATAMRLAPCAIGVGNSDIFAQATRIDYYAETSVGEFLLGV
jgi:oxazoline/thiazoline dehydrogenase